MTVFYAWATFRILKANEASTVPQEPVAEQLDKLRNELHEALGRLERVLTPPSSKQSCRLRWPKPVARVKVGRSRHIKDVFIHC